DESTVRLIPYDETPSAPVHHVHPVDDSGARIELPAPASSAITDEVPVVTAPAAPSAPAAVVDAPRIRPRPQPPRPAPSGHRGRRNRPRRAGRRAAVGCWASTSTVAWPTWRWSRPPTG